MKFNALLLSTILTPMLLVHAMDMSSHGASSGDTDSMDMSAHDSGMSSDSTNTTSEDLIPVSHEEHAHGVPILQTKLTPAERLYWESYNTTTYLTVETPYHNYIITHVVTLALVLFFFYPASLILNNVDSNWFLPMLLTSDLALSISLFCYAVFIDNVEDLYPKNVFGKMGIVLFFYMVLHLISAIIKVTSDHINGTRGSASHYDKLENHFANNKVHNGGIPLSDLSPTDSGSPASTLYRNSNSVSSDSTEFELDDEDANSLMDPSAQEASSLAKSKFSECRDRFLDKILGNSTVVTIANAFDKLARVLFTLTNYTLLCFLFVYFCTGMAVWNCLGRDNHFFNLLAHFIKGGVFFSLGVLSLVRYLGSFEQAGLGWNYAYIGRYQQLDSFYMRKQPFTSMLTMEMIESSLILLYGSTNVFLEHLATPGVAYSTKDLQHVSIAFMYIGCGLSGVLTELKLSTWRRDKFMSALSEVESHSGVSKVEPEMIRTCTPGFSPNPFPAFTIFFTGLLMSQHAQASALSTAVHIQWGSLLTYGSVFRIVTILLMMFWKNNNYETMLKPSRPFTELITSFALLAGGIVFMESTDPVIDAMEYRGFTGMFTLNVSVGMVTLLMGWIMLLFFWKDHLKERRQR